MPGSTSYRSPSYQTYQSPYSYARGESWFDADRYRTPMADRYAGRGDVPGSTRNNEAREAAKDHWGMNFSGKMKPEAEEIFMDIFGGGDFNSGGIGGVDRQYSGGTMNEYQGIGDANFDMGGRWDKGNNEVPYFVGLTASDIHKEGGPKMKTVHFDQDPTLGQMWQHPYNVEKWGDYLPGSDEERQKTRKWDRFKTGGRMGGAETGMERILDRVQRLRSIGRF